MGAAAGGATLLLRGGNLRAAALCGASAALLADADVLLGSADDPIVAQELHRHFTHALIFIPFGAALIAGLAWIAGRLSGTSSSNESNSRGTGGFTNSFLAAAAGLATAGLLDACTGYGTHLLWPFSDARSAWNLISIVDPLFTLPLLIACALGLHRRSAAPCALALLMGLGYLGGGLIQRERAEHAVIRLAEARGHQIERMLARPSFGNLLVWRGLYLADDHWHADAIRSGLGTPTHFPGGQVPAANPERMAGIAAAWGVPAADLQRLWRLADGVVSIEPGPRLGDIRFAMLPNGARSMWGLAPGTTAGRTDWFVDRSLPGPDRELFLAMLSGAGARPLPQAANRDTATSP